VVFMTILYLSFARRAKLNRGAPL